MEIIEIQSAHSLVTTITDQRPVGEHAYQVNCRQFITSYRSWKKDASPRWHSFGVMTLGFERIWMTEAESQQVADAIQAVRSPIVLA